MHYREAVLQEGIVGLSISIYHWCDALSEDGVYL